MRLICTMLLLILIHLKAEAHTIYYQVENRGISARVFYSEDEPASYSQYEIFGPGDKILYHFILGIFGIWALFLRKGKRRD